MSKSKKMVLLSFISLIGLIGCNENPSSGGDSYISVSGIVEDNNGNVVSDATIESNGKTVSSDNSGSFSLKVKSSNSERVSYKIQKDGFFSFTGGVRYTKNQEARIKVSLTPRTLFGVVSAENGGKLSDNNLELDFEPNSFSKSSSDEISVYANTILPDQDNFSTSMPGGDFSAIDNNGDDGTLTSTGAMVIEAEDSEGNTLDLEKLVKTKLKIPASLQTWAPDSIEVWLLNSSGVWELEGMAVREGDFYIFYLKNLGSINCDFFSRNAIVEGTVWDFGDPVPNTEVKIGQISVQTDGEGVYNALIPAGISYKFISDYGTAEPGPLDIDFVNFVDLGVPPDDYLNISQGQGVVVFNGTEYAGMAIAAWAEGVFVWSITSMEGTFGFQLTNPPEKGSKSLTDGYWVGKTISATSANMTIFENSNIYISTAGKVTRNDKTLTFSMLVQDFDELLSGESGVTYTLSGSMKVTAIIGE